MGHHVTGLIAHRETFEKLGSPLSAQPHFALQGGFGFLPLDYENLDDVVGFDAGEAVGKFEYLTPSLIDLLRSASKFGQLAYVETDYHGGIGGQGAAVFQDGEVVLGPLSAEGGAINEALALLGMSLQQGSIDGFAAIGFDRHRDNGGYRDGDASA